MPRAKRQSAKPSSNSNIFADALRFCALVLKDHGTINETHVSIKDHWCTAFNGVLAAGHRCDIDIQTCPQIKLTLEALSKCGQTLGIAGLDGKLLIKADRFKATIPCIAADLLQTPIPDLPIAIIDDRLKEALTIAGELPNENGQQIYNVSVLLNGMSVLSSLGGSLIFQYWHGIDLPLGLSIPKALCMVLAKIDKKLTKFGFSQWSVTFYFEDDSWVRTQLYQEKWPDVGNVFECVADLQQFPADFWPALAAVSPFGEGMVHLRSGVLASHDQEGAGATYELPGLLGSWCYPSRQLAFLRPFATHIDFQAQGPNGPMLLAMGKSARAVIAGVKNV
jgi:hypothetical protein